MAVTRSDESGEQTEQPTRLRLAQARRDGQVARSADLCSVAVVAASLAGLAMLGPSLLAGMERMTGGLLSASERPADLARTSAALRAALPGVVWPALGLCALVSAAAVGANLLQFGLLAAPRQIRPELGRISPGTGLRRIFSRRTAVRSALTAAKLVSITAVAAVTISRQLPSAVIASRMRAADLAGEIGASIGTLVIRVGAVLTALALIDLLYQRWQLRDDLKITRRQLLEDLKRTEGDPLVRARRRSIRAGRRSTPTAKNHPPGDEN